MFIKGQKAWNKGINHLSLKARKRIGEATKKRIKEYGHPKGMKGKKHTEKTKIKQRQWRPTPEQLKKMTHKGSKHPQWLGKRKKVICPQCAKIRYFRPTWPQKFCSQKCAWESRKGKPLSWKTHQILPRPNCKICHKTISLYAKAVCRKCFGKYYKGKKSHLWKGGLTSINKLIRASAKYRIWRKKIFERDDYTCQICRERGGKLEADHIKPFAIYKKLRFRLSNGRTLCVKCHKITPTYLNGTKHDQPRRSRLPRRGNKKTDQGAGERV